MALKIADGRSAGFAHRITQNTQIIALPGNRQRPEPAAFLTPDQEEVITMKRKPALFLLILLVACFSATVIADGYNPYPRPIMGLLSGGAYWVPEEYCDGVNYEPPVGSPLTTMSTFFGKVSHLGRSEFHTMHCSTNDGQYLLRGVGTLIAANGDELWTEYTAEAISPVVVPGTIVYEVMNVVVGGTGRFEDASGVIPALVFVTLTFDDQGNPNAQAEMELAGNVSY